MDLTGETPGSNGVWAIPGCNRGFGNPRK